MARKTANANVADTARRPRPPAGLVHGAPAFVPAPDLAAWVRDTFIEPHGTLANPDHAPLLLARIACIWTNIPSVRRGRAVAAQVERPLARGGAWAAARAEQQIRAWCDGLLPDFLLTFDAAIADDLADASWCSLCEHELYHARQSVDAFGQPAFRPDGLPSWTLAGHDCEEFVGVVRRYGAGAAASGTAALVAAASRPPEIAPARCAVVCGTCVRLVA